MRIPKSLHRYFWDVDVNKLDPNSKPYFIISRLLDKGNIEAARWVKSNYNVRLIRKTIQKYRDFSLRSISFWALIFKVPREEVKCFQEPYLTVRKSHWPY